MTYITFSWILYVCSRFNNVAHAVDCGSPTYQLALDQPCSDPDGVTPPANTQEGATVVYSCKSLLWRTKALYSYCPVERCEANGQWRKAELSCGSSECYGGTSDVYTGSRNCTATGKLCQRWDTQFPHPHNFTNSSSFPDNTLDDAGSHCRDPGGLFGTPWCYTVEEATEREACGIPECSTVIIGQGKCSNDYCGDINGSVITDNSCSSIAPLMSNYARNVGSVIKFSCQSLLEGFTSATSYCPVHRCKSDYWWTEAFISCGENECYTASASQDYVGKRSCTKDGWECQRWDSQSPHSHTYTSHSAFPDPQVSKAENYCRDPDGLVGEPWCYTTNPDVVNQTCDIPLWSLSLPLDNGNCNPTTTTYSSTTSTPATTPQGETSKYVKTLLSRIGYEAQFTVPAAKSAINCARMCSEDTSCVFLVFDNNKSCTLYRQNAANTDTVNGLPSKIAH